MASMLHAQGGHAAEQLEDVQKHLRQLQQKEEQIRQQLSDRSLQAVSEINRSGLPDDDPAQRPLPDLLQEATVLDTGAKYLERLEASPTSVWCGRMHAPEAEIAACIPPASIRLPAAGACNTDFLHITQGNTS